MCSVCTPVIKVQGVIDSVVAGHRWKCADVVICTPLITPDLGTRLCILLDEGQQISVLHHTSLQELEVSQIPTQEMLVDAHDDAKSTILRTFVTVQVCT